MSNLDRTAISLNRQASSCQRRNPPCPVFVRGGAMLSTRAIAIVAGVLLAFVQFAAADDKSPIFNRDIRPILSDKCFKCHGPDSAARKADLRLDIRDIAVKAEAIVPGKPDESLLVERVFSDDPQQVMPPPGSGKMLTANEKDKLRQWIAAGAEYQSHWSFIPV